ncbi:MAG: bifunctional UDP-N-acetylglucosamine diphosphorylase/glucosamine-1-phosphate N-acetyltransferase GlmU [Nitrospirales bacterium]
MTSAIILAAGQGTRMKSSLPKVLHCVAGRPMVWYAASLARTVSSGLVAIVVGHGADRVKSYLNEKKAEWDPFQIVDQAQQLGTGHAVLQAFPAVSQSHGAGRHQVLILNGDTPLLTEETLSSLLAYHQAESATLTLLTTELADPGGYGRVVRGQEGNVQRVVEDRDASQREKAIREINVGTYVVEQEFLGQALSQLRPQNAQGEYYLTDIIEQAVQQGKKVVGFSTSDPLETTGINTRIHLAMAEKVMRGRINERHLLRGVTMMDPDRVLIDDGVEIGRDTILYPGVILEGHTHIGDSCVIQANTHMTDTVLGRSVVVRDACVLQGVLVEDEVVIGPFAHLRPGSRIQKKAKVGNFVELKQTEVGEGSKVNHLSYLGDTVIGKNVNVGAGTITCNYDGFRKERTTIEDDVFIGSDVQLIAPVTIGKGALVAAGTTVTEDVPPDALGIARVQQVNREGTAARRRVLLKAQSKAKQEKNPPGESCSPSNNSEGES